MSDCVTGRVTKEMIYGLKLNSLLKHSWLFLLLKNHNEYEARGYAKTTGFICRQGRTRELYAVSPEGVESLFSWARCISGKWPQDDRYLKDAMRVAIEGQISSLKGACEACGAIGEEVHHAGISFKQLSKDFISMAGYSPIEFAEGAGGRNFPLPKDSDRKSVV